MTGSITVLQKDETDQRKIVFAINQMAGWANTNGAAVSGAVRYDTAQSLTDAQKTQARSNIYAAPFDALAYNGMQINGSMDVSQANGTTAVPSGYVVDGFQLGYSGTMILSAAQVADAPPGLNNSIKVTVTTAQASLGVNDTAYIVQFIEGYRTSRLAFGTANAQSVSVGFWSKIHRVGLYSGSIRNAAATRSFPFTFTQTVADTWQYNTVTIPGDVTGTWVGNANAVGLAIFFAMAAGSTFQAPANVWVAGNLVAATGTTNGVAATSDVFQITGVVVLPGIELPSASRSPFIMRPFDQELITCRRYLRLISSGSGAWFIGGASAAAQILIAYEAMREIAPTLSLWSQPILIADPGQANVSFSSPSFAVNSSSLTSATVNFGIGGGTQTGTPVASNVALLQTDNAVKVDKRL